MVALNSFGLSTLVAALTLLLLSACGTGNTVAPVDDLTGVPAPAGGEPQEGGAGVGDVGARAPATNSAATRAASYRVKKGDTLYSIAFANDLDYRELARWNGVGHGYLIRVGQLLSLAPPAGLVSKPAPPAKVDKPVVRPPVAAVKGDRPKPASKPVTPAAADQAWLQGRFAWLWPTDGKVVKRFSRKGTRKRGIAISGKPGQVVRAAASGKVVYAGTGLVGYGKLIILKHNKTYLSAYAHNSRLLVAEGQWVRAGAPIARMGSSGTDRTQLHFEIRKRGKAIDPLRLLPRR